MVERCIAGAGCATAGGEALRGDPSSSSSSSPSYGGTSRVASACIDATDRGETPPPGLAAPEAQTNAPGPQRSSRKTRRPISFLLAIEARAGLVLASVSSSIRPRGAIRRPLEEDRKSHMVGNSLYRSTRGSSARTIHADLARSEERIGLTWVWPHLREETRRAECGPRVPRTEICPPSQSYPVRRRFYDDFYDHSRHLPTLQTSDIVSRQRCVLSFYAKDVIHSHLSRQILIVFLMTGYL